MYKREDRQIYGVPTGSVRMGRRWCQCRNAGCRECGGPPQLAPSRTTTSSLATAVRGDLSDPNSPNFIPSRGPWVVGCRTLHRNHLLRETLVPHVTIKPPRLYALLSQMKLCETCSAASTRQKAAESVHVSKPLRRTWPSTSTNIQTFPDRTAFNLYSDLQCVSCHPPPPVRSAGSQWVARQQQCCKPWLFGICCQHEALPCL